MAKKTKKKELECISLDEILSDESYYEEYKEYLKNSIQVDLLFKDEDILVEIDDEQYEYTNGNLLTLLIIAKPFVTNKVKFTKDFLINLTDIDNQINYFNKVIEVFSELDISINKELVDIISEEANVASFILKSYGGTLNLYDLTKLIRIDERAKKMVNFKFSKEYKRGIEFEEMNRVMDKLLADFVSLLEEYDTCYTNLLASNSGINKRQLKDTFLIVGPKPNEIGKIFNMPIDSSYIRGINEKEFYIDAVGARKALNSNYKKTKDSGYLTRKLTSLCVDNIINSKFDDCGTKSYIEVEIKNQKTLDRLKGRYIILPDDIELPKDYFKKMMIVHSGKEKKITLGKNTFNDYHMIDPKKDTFLIERTVYMRSPIKCACKAGICRTCYGSLWKFNQNKNVGIIGVLLLTAILTQLMLSSKHLLEAKASKLLWGDYFKDFFTVNKEEILPNFTNMKIIITNDDILETDDDDDDIVKVLSFTVEYEKERYQIDNLPVIFTLNNEIIERIEDYYNKKEEAYVIDGKEFSEIDPVFTYSMDNNELSASLNNITTLIETNKYIKEMNIDEIFNRFIDLLNDSPIKIHSIHIEFILKEMCKIKNNDRTLFKDENLSDDEIIEDILRVTDSLVKNPALSKSMVYEKFYNQITQMLDTYKKNQRSLFDILLH